MSEEAPDSRLEHEQYRAIADLRMIGVVVLVLLMLNAFFLWKIWQLMDEMVNG